MIKNYLLIAWRNMIRNRVYAAVNVLGLALGITCCILIYLWVGDEKSIDNFGPAGENLYIVYESYTADGVASGTYSTPIHYDKNMAIPYVEEMQHAIPEIKHLVCYKTGYDLPWGFPETLQVG